MILLPSFLAFLGLLIVVPFMLEAKRRRVLVKVNGRDEIDRAIIERKLFEGMTDRQLHQAWGAPDEIAIHAHRRRRTETWLYGGDGSGRFRDHVRIEDGFVKAWSHRRRHGRG